MSIRIELQLKPMRVQYAYAVIGQSGYGRMDESTPYAGLAAFGVSSCTVIVCHCFTLNRTVLIHSPNYMYVKQTLEPIFNWTIAKGENMYTENNVVEVVVLRGYLYNYPNMSIGYNHFGFMNELRDFVRITYPAHSINIVDAGRLLESSNGSLIVDKVTAKITVLRLPLQFTLCYNNQQMCREIFNGDLFPFIYPNNGKIIRSRHLQFDVNRYTLHGTISDHCRLVLRAKCSLNQTDRQIHDLLLNFKIDVSESVYANLIQALQLPASAGLPCECCSNKGIMMCGKCRGAWYCGRSHQHDDWPHHKRFCRLYSIKNK